MFRRHGLLGLALLHLAALAGSLPAAGIDDVTRAAQALIGRYQAELAELAAWCDQQGLRDPAAITRQWAEPRDPAKVYVTMLPEAVGPPPAPAGETAAAAQWRERWLTLREEQADALFGMARAASRKGRASLAFDLVMLALHENPDHPAMRRMLGYERYQGQWRTQYEINRLRTGYVWDDRFGWISKANVERYEQGQRYSDGRWVTAEEDARLHANIFRGWDIQTEHYAVRTNHSLEAGVGLGVKLERLYRVWKRLFIRYYATEAQVASLFEGTARRVEPAARHAVVYFRNKDEYVRTLRPVYPNIAISVGIYIDRFELYGGAKPRANQLGRAYFYAEGGDDRTLVHEATHQLFHETRPVPPGIASRANFWIVEGIAMYMESLRDEDGWHVLGGLDDDRIKAARHRLLNDQFYIPLNEFTSYSIDQVQADRRIATLYSQAAGLTNFLVHYDGGRYRDALVSYLATVYSGRDDALTLLRLTGTPYPEMDKQYREFMSRP